MSRSLHELLRKTLVHLKLAATYANTKDLDQLVIDTICMRLSAGLEVLASWIRLCETRLFGDS